WDQAEGAEGIGLVRRALRRGRPGPYEIQASIAVEHARARRPEDTDWRRIAALYGLLAGVAPSPVVELNRAVAVAMAGGLEAGLAMIDGLAEPLHDYHLLHSARASLLRRLGRDAEAAEAYRTALSLAANPVERAFLERRLAE